MPELSQVAKALEAAHSRRLVHWDLSPHDVLVEPGGDGHVLLGDFGIAKPEGRGGLHDFVDFAYMSPEEIREELLVPQSNVYALACILVECLTGSPPYASEHRLGVAYAHILQPPPRLTERRPDLPPAIDGVLATAMAKDPDDRLYSPSELVRAAAEALGLGLPGPGGPIGPPGRRLERLSAGSRAGERDAGTREHPRAVATVRGLRRLLTGTKRVA